MNQIIKTHFENSSLSCLPEETLESVLFCIGRVGTLSRCRQLCKYLEIFIKEKNIFQRYIAVCIPEKEIIDYWLDILQTAEVLAKQEVELEKKELLQGLVPIHVDVSYGQNRLNNYIKIYKSILEKSFICPTEFGGSIVLYKPFSFLFSILNSKGNKPLVDLAKHIESLLLNSQNDDIKNASFQSAFVMFYSCKYRLIYGVKDNIDLSISIFNLLSQKNSLKESLAAMPPKRLMQAKKDFVNHLNYFIRNNAGGVYNENHLMRLAIIAQDSNQEVSNEARRLLNSLFDDNDNQAGALLHLYTDHRIFLKGVIETNSFRHALKRAISLQIGVHLFFTLCFSFIPLICGAKISSVVTKNLFVLSEYFTAFLLNGLAISQILGPIERSLRCGVHLDSWFYLYFCIILVANLSLIMTRFLKI